jgi:tRNA pseudouridine synthase 10
MQQLIYLIKISLYIANYSHRKRFRTEIISRNYFEKHFIPQNINVEKLQRLIPIPPLTPSNGVRLHEITFTGPTVFVAGRYNKFSRELSQTPWILNGKRMSESSVQEIIVQQVAPYFKVSTDSITFMSSGREDVDVRCLGRGRPFVLEIMNSSRSILDQASAITMEQEVGKSGFVSVRDLQMVRR